MALSYKARRRWTLVILLVGLPVYIVLAVTLTDWLRANYEGFGFWVELIVFVALGFLWALPFRFVFRGVGKADPEAQQQDTGDKS